MSKMFTLVYPKPHNHTYYGTSDIIKNQKPNQNGTHTPPPTDTYTHIHTYRRNTLSQNPPTLRQGDKNDLSGPVLCKVKKIKHVEFLDIMPQRMALSSTGIVSSSVVGHQYKQPLFQEDQSPPLMKTPSGKWRLPFWRIAG